MISWFFENGAKFFNGERKVFPTNGVGTTVYTNGKKLNLSLYLTSYMKISSKCHIDLNVKAKTIKHLEEIIKEKSLWPWGRISQRTEKRRSYLKIDNLKFIKIKKFCSLRVIIKKVKRQSWTTKNILCIVGKGLVHRTYKELITQ